MKKIFGLLIMLLGIICLGACNKDDEKVKIGIVQQMNHTSLNTISDAIKSELATLGYNEDNSEIYYKQGDNDSTELSQIVDEYISKEVNIVIPVATKAAAASLAAANAKIPVVFAACSDPVASGLLTNMSSPEGFVTGTSNAIQVDKIIDTAINIEQQNGRTLTKIGFIHTSGETNAQSTINNAKNYVDTISTLNYVDKTISNASDITDAVDALYNDGCQAILVPNDNTLASTGNMSVLSNACNTKGIPLYTGADSQVKDGGFLNVGIEYSELGRVTAQMADKILDGSKVSEVPVKVFSDINELYYFVNKTTQTALNYTLPTSITTSSKYIEFN